LTKARKTEAGWSLSGYKIYSTGAPVLKWAIVWAVTDETPPRVGQFLVPFDLPGIEIQYETWDHLGLRASGSHDVVFRDVSLPFDHAVDIRDPGAWGPPTASFDVWINLTLSALYNGVATAARDWLVQWLQNRRPSNLGAALATVPRLQTAVGEIEALLQTNRIMIADVARRGDAKTLEPAESSLLKYVATGNAIRICEKAIELTGNTGLTRSNPLERHLRDVLCSRVHQPQNDMILTYAGKTALGV
jgi:alkylation response protein AidB-like acyl-CoA dehydrogenase